MKLKLYDFDFNNVIEFSGEKSVCLTVENDSYFADMTKHFKGVLNHKVPFSIFNDNEEPLSERDYTVIVDLFEFETVSRVLTGKVIKHICDRCRGNSEYLNKLSSKINLLYLEIVQVLQDYNIDFDSLPDCALEDVFKLFSVVPASFGYSLIEKYLNMFEIAFELKLYKLIVFVNAKSFFCKNDIIELQKSACYKNLPLMLLENKLHTLKMSEYENNYIIDSDLFLTKI